MVKKVFSKVKLIHPVALVCLGWFAFVAGIFAQPLGWKLVLLSAARVLPEVLLPINTEV